MGRPCATIHPLSVASCKLCWLSENDPYYRNLWKVLDRKQPSICPELGPPLNPLQLKRLDLDLERCGCLGKIRECGVHGVCTTGEPRAGVMCCVSCPDRPELRGTNVDLNWVYGVTTCPQRKDDLLPRTLASLKEAGFPKPHLFVDGADDSLAWKRHFGLDVTARYPAVMVAKNWVLSLYELYAREPHADRYAIFQDDFVTYKNLRSYLNRWFPEKGYLNLYLFDSYQLIARDQGLLKEGWFEAPVGPPDWGMFENGSRPQFGKSAIGLVFDRQGVVELLKSDHIVTRPQTVETKSSSGKTKIDGGIVAAMNKAGYREYAHWPSLTQHTGDVSSIRSAHAAPFPHASSFRGEDYDALELLNAEQTKAVV